MVVRRIVADLQTDSLAATRDFYRELMGLEVAMDLDWIVTLRSPAQPAAQLQLITADATAPRAPQLTIEVDDVDRVFETARAAGETIVYPLTDEPWGVRRFLIEDPAGTLVNVMSHRER